MLPMREGAYQVKYAAVRAGANSIYVLSARNCLRFSLPLELLALGFRPINREEN